jgi:hypothetical protein
MPFRGAAEIVDQDVDAVHAVQNLTDDLLHAACRTEVGLDEQRRCLAIRKRRAGRRRYHRAGGGKAPGNGFTHALGATRDDDALTGEFIRIHRKSLRTRHQ